MQQILRNFTQNQKGELMVALEASMMKTNLIILGLYCLV